jgi:uncharacterized protein (TIGR03435 family)
MVVIGWLTAFSAPAQSPVLSEPSKSLTFEVASIKPSDPSSREKWLRAPVDSNTLTLKGLPLKELIQLAYGPSNGWGGYSLTPDRIVGGPNWLDDQRYDLEAKAAGSASQQERIRMLRTLLIERCKLSVHFEPRTVSVYVLAVEKGGPKMKERKPDDGGEPAIMRDTGSLHFIFRDTPMDSFVRFLQSRVLGRTVSDKTGLTGKYDFDLAWRPDESQFGGTFARSPERESDLPDLFTALKQIGLKLEAAKGELQFLIIDHVEKPSEN